MVHISKKYLEEKIKKAAWEEFVREVERSKFENEIFKGLEKWFTPSERIMIEKRLAISHLLDKGLPYRKIGEILDVSSRTINFVKNGLKYNQENARRRRKIKKIKNNHKEKIIPLSVKKKYHRLNYKGTGPLGILS